MALNDEAREAWLAERIYTPRERVRARTNDASDLIEVFDGVEIHTMSPEDFHEAYDICAQSQVYNKPKKRHEYHRNVQ